MLKESDINIYLELCKSSGIEPSEDFLLMKKSFEDTKSELEKDHDYICDKVKTIIRKLINTSYDKSLDNLRTEIQSEYISLVNKHGVKWLERYSRVDDVLRMDFAFIDNYVMQMKQFHNKRHKSSITTKLTDYMRTQQNNKPNCGETECK